MFETQIAQGVALLDQQTPGWLERVNVDALDLDAFGFSPAEGEDAYWVRLAAEWKATILRLRAERATLQGKATR